MSERLTGKCLCGACAFTAEPGDAAGVCHCGMCRKWTGGINMAVQCKNVTWNDDAPLKAYRSSDWAERVFCGTCGSNLFWRAVDAPEGEQILALMAFDEPERFPVTSEIFIDEKLSTYALAGDTKKMTGAEVIAMFAAEVGAG